MDRVTPGEASGMGVPGSDLPMTLEESQWAPSEFAFVTLSNGGQRHSHGVSVDYFWKGMWGPWDCSSIEKIVFFFFSLKKKKWLKGKPSRSLGIDSQHIKILEWLPNNQFLQAFTIPWDTVETSMELWEEFIQEDQANELQLLWQAWKIRGEAPDRARQLQKSFCPPVALSQAET